MSVAIPGLLTFLVIGIFAPFGIRDLALGDRLLFGLGIGSVSSVSVLLVVSVGKWLFPNLMQEDSWTVGKEILLFLLVEATICLLVFFCFLLFDLSHSPPFRLFKLVVLYTIAISSIPIAILVLYEQYSHQKKSARRAIELTQHLRDVAATARLQQSSLALFEAENGKVELQVAYDRILFLKSDGNYVEVFYLGQQDGVQKKLIRNRLKKLSESLPSALFFHAHKSYVVNGKQIERVEGNARNFELLMHATDERLPVSRSKSKELSTFLKSLPA